MLLSVVILFTDNDSSFLEGAIKSIRNNIKFSDYEIILVDNRNNQKEKIFLNDVKIVSKGYNLNCFEGRRFGFENSKGDFIWNFDVDDLMIGELYKEDIKKEVDFMQMYYSFPPGSKRNPILKKHLPRAKQSITDFSTTAEVKEKYGVKDSWIFHIAKEYNIPRTFNRGKTFWSKKHIDDYFAKKAPDPEIKEWYSTQDMQEKFGMTLTAIYSFVSKNAIPKKKVGIMVYYSKKHVDIAKGLIAPEEPKYYTIAEAMERFNLTRDQLYHYVKYHNIPRIKVGKYTKILRAELDKFFEPPKIE